VRLKMPVKRIFLFIGVVLVFAIIGFLARKNHNDFEAAIIDQARDQLLLIARSETQSINKYISNIQQELEILSSEAVIRKNLFQTYTEETKEEFYALDDSYKDVKGLVSALYLIDARGVVKYVSPFNKKLLNKDFSSLPDVSIALTLPTMYTSGILGVNSAMQEIAVDQPVCEGGKCIGLIRALIRVDKISELVGLLNETNRRFTFLIEHQGNLISYPVPRYIGANVVEVLSQGVAPQGRLQIQALVKMMQEGREGSGVFNFSLFSRGFAIPKTVVAFAPISVSGNNWSIAVAMDYNVISTFIDRNARDNIVYFGFIIFVLFSLGGISYWRQKQRADEIQRLYTSLAKSHAELQTTQSILIQAEKMEIVGKLASGVAHEVKNPLAVILQGLEYLKRKVCLDDKNGLVLIQDIENAVQKADSTIKGLLDFSSVTNLELKPANIHEIIENSLALLGHLFTKHRVKVIKDFKEGIPEVSVDKNKIEQALVNIIMNALQAMPDGGDLLIKTYGEVNRVVVEISDSGSGISLENLKNIFEPFFTTRRFNGGTGLGLSIVKNIMDMHNGEISILNNTGKPGATVKLIFKV